MLGSALSLDTHLLHDAAMLAALSGGAVSDITYFYCDCHNAGQWLFHFPLKISEPISIFIIYTL